MNKLLIFSIFVFFNIALASWDGPIETVEKEESIRDSVASHNTDDHDLSVDDDEIKQNRVDPVPVTKPPITTTETPSASSILTLSPLIFAIGLLF